MVKGRNVHLLEAKRKLNRTVIGQVLVGESLLKHVFDPAEVIKVAVCGEGNPDLEWFCRQNEIKVTLFPQVQTQKTPKNADNEPPAPKMREDYRQPPNLDRFRAFLAGWTDAVKGKLYASVYNKKTHANMGNLFGWIYGEQPWEHYLVHANEEWQKSELE